MADRTRKGTRVEQEKKKNTMPMRMRMVMPSQKMMMMMMRYQRKKMHNQKKRRRMLQNPKKKKENIVSVDYYNNAVIVDDDLVVSQILSRLPVKSLMRCKCVCKGWKSIMEHDSHYIDLHHTHSQARPVLLIAKEPDLIDHPDPDHKRQICFYSADLEYDSDGDNVMGANLRSTVRTLNTPGEFELGNYTFRLGPVRGLICLAESYYVQIYNVGTGQVITPWIKSAVAMKRKYKGSPYEFGFRPAFEFGFDPNTGKHKVVFVWQWTSTALETRKERRKEASICEVLTVGDTRWRIIDDVPPPCHHKLISIDKSVYANGSVYWAVDSEDSSESLLAFHVGPEKFRMIPIPEFTRTNPPLINTITLIEINGFPTIIRTTHEATDPTLTMWKFHDRNKENGSEEEDWTRVNVTLPFSALANYANFHPIAGKDHMILVYQPYQQNVNHAQFYLYNLSKKTLREFTVRGISSVPDNGCETTCSTMVESLF